MTERSDFPVLLAKAVDAAVSDVRGQEPTNPTPMRAFYNTEVHEMTKSDSTKLSKADADRAIEVAIEKMQKAAVEAEAAGEGWRAQSLRKEIAEIKLTRVLKNGQQGSNGWPGVTKLFDRTGVLPEDTSIKGI